MTRRARFSADDTGRIIEHPVIDVPSSTLLMARLPIFQPTQRPVRRRGEWFGTPWGRSRVTGRLGQRHADLLECILHAPLATHLPDAGGIELLVDPAVVRRRLAAGTGQYSGDQLDVLLNDLMTSLVEVESNNKVRARGSLIDHVIEAPSGGFEFGVAIGHRSPSGWFAGTPRTWMRVRLGFVAVTLLTRDLCLVRSPEPLCALPHGITQAVVRLIYTHRSEPAGGWIVDNLICAVAGTTTLTSATIRNRRRELKEDAVHLLALGLVLEGGRLRRR